MSKLAKKTHQKILGKIFWVRVNEPNSIFFLIYGLFKLNLYKNISGDSELI
jgi:hypothetical protein